jgi:pimeloyl-ACP methyl ester carboxylesterase
MAKTPKHHRKPSNPAPISTPPSAFDRAIDDLRRHPQAFPNVSPRWLAGAAAVAILAALTCAWLTLCLLYWQGSWQLLYHPKAAISSTPASLGIPYEPIHFAVTETGTTQLTGWWIPDPEGKRTVLLLHGAYGNLSDTLNTIAQLHRQHLSIFAIDYRGYGQSLPAKPTEKSLHQDAEWALSWLTITRNLPAESILVYGTGLGANLAAELASEPASIHSQLAGAILDQPSDQIMAPVFNDPRSHIVPAHWLVKDRYDLTAAATKLQIPSLWLFSESKSSQSSPANKSYQATPTQKSSAWLKPPIATDPHFAEILRRWLDDLA